MSESDRAKWDARHVSSQGEGGRPRGPAWLEEWTDSWPRAGRALDVGSGRGGFSLWCAERGLAALAVDISGEALAQLRQVAGEGGLSVETRTLDLDHEALPEGPYDLVGCFNFKPPGGIAPLLRLLGAGGVLVMETATTANLERHAHPSRRWLVEPGQWCAEARGASGASGFEILHDESEWHDGRHTERLIVRRPEGGRP